MKRGINEVIIFGYRPDGKPTFHLGSCINANLNQAGNNGEFKCPFCNMNERLDRIESILIEHKSGSRL
jgi:hypothetical protein